MTIMDRLRFGGVMAIVSASSLLAAAIFVADGWVGLMPGGMIFFGLAGIWTALWIIYVSDKEARRGR